MTIQEIAEWLKGEILGGDSRIAQEILNVAKIEEAAQGTITFLANPKYEKYLENTQASAVLVSRKLDTRKYEHRSSLVFIKVDDPYVAFLQVLKHFTPKIELFNSGIHPTAFIASNAQIGENVSLGPNVVVGEQAVIGRGTKVGAGCVVGNYTHIGEDCTFYPNVVVYHQCQIGNRVNLHSGVVVGSDGFGFAPQSDGSYEKIPQLGIVVIEDDVEIGANTTIDRATIGETRICRGVKLDNLIQIAHNVVVGENTVIAAQTGISGSTKIGKNCQIAGQVGIAGHIHIADRTVILAQSGVPNNIEEPGKTLFGYPADDARKAQRAYIGLKMLPDTIREIAALQKKVTELENKISELQHKEK
jgi:UDP-3-O-[3-hydroxymyristoyl] glucosamine N-acyltransferase